MLLLLLLASVTLQAPSGEHRVAAATPATASVRIVRAAELKTDRVAATEESLLRKAEMRERDGSVRTATLVEYY